MKKWVLLLALLSGTASANSFYCTSVTLIPDPSSPEQTLLAPKASNITVTKGLIIIDEKQFRVRPGPQLGLSKGTLAGISFDNISRVYLDRRASGSYRFVVTDRDIDDKTFKPVNIIYYGNCVGQP